MRIAVDAMGSDNAPAVEVEGAVFAARDYGVGVTLVGDKEVLEKELKKHEYSKDLVTIHHASQTIAMDESPFESVRRKKDSSINVCSKLVKEGKADAMVSAGNTGAVVCSSSLFMRLLDFVDKPGIMIAYPTLKGPVVLVDGGANIDPKPKDLFLYGIMGSVYMQLLLKKANPSIGLLNIGEESSKGTSILKETHKWLSGSMLNFIGNVEGKEMFSGDVNVVVADGFIGNVVLKISESIAITVTEFLKREIKKSFLTKLGALLCRPAFMSFKKEIDYAEYGGAPLLGIDGVVIICHGRSTSKAIKNAIRVASQFVESKFTSHLVETIDKVSIPDEKTKK